MTPEPFALQIYRWFTAGESIAELAERLGIPKERIEMRLRAAARHYDQLQRSGQKPSGPASPQPVR